MIRKFIITIIPLALLIVLSGSQMSDDGRAGKTNSPGETTCVNSCHNSYVLNSGPGSITLQSAGMPTFQYVPGHTYNMSVTVAHAGRSLFGVGLEALLPSGANAGTLTITDPNSTQIKTIGVNGNNRRNVVHTENGGVSPDAKVFNFDWTAPAAGTGNITFYFSGVAANGNNNNNLDYVYNASQVITEQCPPPAQPANISGADNICEGSTVTYSVTPVAGASSYNWILPSGWTGVSTTESISVTTGSTGDISVTAQNSCGTGTPATLNVTVNPSPVPYINLHSVMNVDTLVSTPATYYQWYINSAEISGANYFYHVPDQNGDYTVEVTDVNGCTGLSSVYSYLTLSAENLNQKNKFEFRINSYSKKLFISVNDVLNTHFSICDIQGKIILQSNLISDENTIDVSYLNEGLYFISFTVNNKRITEKIYIH